MKLLPLDKYGYPVENIIGRPVTNFLRIILHTRKIECRDCWYSKQAQKNSYFTGITNTVGAYGKNEKT